MRATQLRLSWQWAFVFTDGAAMTPRLSWHATEFGRRTDDGRYRIVHTDAGWQLLDAAWNPVGAATRTIVDSQQLAERVVARGRGAAPREASDGNAQSAIR